MAQMLGYAKRILGDVLPPQALNAARHLYYAAFRAGLAVKCEYSDLLAGPKSTFPPALLRFRVSETTDLSVFLNVGERTAHDLESNLAGIGLTLENCDTVLDFGCGAGRTLRWLIQQFPHVRFYGTDVDPQAIVWTKDHLPGAEFSLNGPTPPIGYPDASFDFVYIVSVFTHLAFEHQKLWLAELHRIIRPEGIVLFTVHGERTWHWLSPDKLARLRRDGFLFETSRKLRGILPDWYHTSFMTEHGVEQLLGQSFRVLAYNPAGMGYQDVVIARRN